MVRLYAQAAIAAAAMPVVGFITGKVVGEASDKAPILAWTGVLVYATALAASYAHLRHYYARFDAEGVRAAPFIAFAVEAATFYLSFASVVLGSTWALWGSLVGAGVVFWGNLTSMGLGLKGRLGAERQEGALALEAGPSRTGQEGAFPPRAGNGEEREAPELQPPVPTLSPWNGTDPVRTPWNGTDAVRASWNGNGTDAVRTPPLGERGGGTPWVREAPPVNGEAGTEEEGELSRLLEALSSPKGPSALARELSWPKSTVARRLKHLVEMGLVQSDGGVYRRAEGASA